MPWFYTFVRQNKPKCLHHMAVLQIPHPACFSWSVQDISRFNSFSYDLKNHCLCICLAAVGLDFCSSAFSSGGEWGLLSRCNAGSCCGEFSCSRAWVLGQVDSVAVAHGLSCTVSCGIFLDQGSNRCPRRWQRNPLSLSHQGSPHRTFCSSLPSVVVPWVEP